MKFRSAIMIVAMVTFGSLSTLAPQLIAPSYAAEGKDATGLTSQQKIDLVTKNKGVFGNGDQLRRFFFGDLAPLGVQPGGAGMIVTLYNKANNITFAYCADFDVVVAVKKGKVTTFPSAEVK